MTYFIYSLALIISIFTTYLSAKKLVINNHGKSLISFRIVSILTIGLLIGLRAESVGVDTAYYNVFFREFSYFDLSSIFQNQFEPGFSILTLILKRLGSGEIIFHTTFALLCLFFFYQFYKKNNQLLHLAVFFAFTTGFVFLMMNGVRQVIAIAIISLSIKHIYTKQFVRYALLIILASLFHYSALLMLPIYLLSLVKNINYKIWILLFIITIFINPFNYLDQFTMVLSVFPKNYANYLGSLELAESKFSLGFIFHLCLSFIALYFSTRLKDNVFKNHIFILYFIGVVLMNMTWQSAVLQRFNIYFIFFQIPAYAYITNYLLKNRKFEPLLLIVLLFLISFFYKISVGDSGCAPYFFNL